MFSIERSTIVTVLCLLWLASAFGCDRVSPQGDTPSAWMVELLDSTVRPCVSGGPKERASGSFLFRVQVWTGPHLPDAEVARALSAIRSSLKAHGGTLQVDEQFIRLTEAGARLASSDPGDFAAQRDNVTPQVQGPALILLIVGPSVQNGKAATRVRWSAATKSSGARAQKATAPGAGSVPIGVLDLGERSAYNPVSVGYGGLRTLISALGGPGPHQGEYGPMRCLPPLSEHAADFIARFRTSL